MNFRDIVIQRWISLHDRSVATYRVHSSKIVDPVRDALLATHTDTSIPERMDTPVARIQAEGVLRYHSVPRLLPGYNKFMGGVDRIGQLRMMYGFDRKSKRYWFRLFFQFFDYAVNNIYLLYKHGCIARNICSKDLLGFRLELVHVLLKVVGSKSGSTVQK